MTASAPTPAPPPTPTPPPTPAPSPMGRGTLTRQLVLRVTALVAVVAIALSGLTALGVYRILANQLDQQVMGAAGRVRDPLGSRGPVVELPRDAGGAGQAQGLLLYLQGVGGIVQVGRDREVVGAEASERLEALTETGRPLSVALPELGVYRVYVFEQDGGVVVTGLPTRELREAMVAVLGIAGLLTLLVLVIAFLAARAVVERSLRPLARLATTARYVAALPLASGEVAVPVRVPAADADARSEVGQVGLAFNHMLDNVEGALEVRHRSETRLRQFVADASHELRNPLASIRGYSELTRRTRAELPEDTRHALGRIDSESARMARLVEDLLLLARLDAGPQLTPADVDLADLVVSAVSDAQAAGPEHAWSVALPDEPIVARVDPHRITQVLANLLANARTHTPPGTSVSTSLAREGGWAVLRVADDGPGIPESVRGTLFERFTRADVARARATGTSSTGLGLAIVAAVVQAHSGTVSVASEPGRGATFTVRLPLTR